MPQSASHALPAPGSHSAGLLDDIRRLLSTARRNWPIVTVAALACLTASVVYLARKTTSFHSTSRLLVLQQGRSPLSLTRGDAGQSVEGIEDYLPTQALILRSPLVVGRALVSLGFGDRSTREVVNRLTVSRPDPAAKVLQVGYLSADPADAEAVLRAVLASYESFLDDRYHKKNHDVTELLVKARDELGRDLQELEQKYLELYKEAPAQAADDAGRSSQARRVELWDHAAGEARLKTVYLKAQLELGRKLAANGASLRAINQAMGHLGGAASPNAQPQDDGSADPDTALAARLLEELTDLELQRGAATRLLEGHERRRSGRDPSRPIDETQLARLLAADPDVAELRDRLRAAQQQRSASRIRARNSSDLAARQAAGQVGTLQAELDRLMAQRRPMLLQQLGRDEFADAEANRAKAQLDVVLAREQTLKDKLAAIDADILLRLENRERELTGKFGPKDAPLIAVRSQIARLRDGRSKGPSHQEHGAIRDLLDSIEHGLASVEAMRVEIQGKFAEDLDASKRSEVDWLAIANVRSNLERQRALFNTVVDQLKQVQLAGDFNGISAQVVDPPSTSPVRPNSVLVLGVALAAGLVLGLGSAVVVDQLDSRLHTVEEIRHAVGLSVLGLIPRLTGGRLATPGGPGLLGHVMPRSPAAEGFRVVRTNLDFLRRSRPLQVIMVTSPMPGDGKTTTASNLAISLAQAGRRVLLVDADLRRPRLDAIHGLSRDFGLSQILQDRVPVHLAVQATSVAKLDVVTAGPDVDDPAELLTSLRLVEFLAAVRRSYDSVIIDSPPLLTVADAAILGGLVDGVLLVVRASAIRRQDAERTSESLKSIGSPVFGVVINGIDGRECGYGYGADRASNLPLSIPRTSPRRLDVVSNKSPAHGVDDQASPTDCEKSARKTRRGGGIPTDPDDRPRSAT
ncbi:polysaccharide biosynthesis tyrosine autokinase [Isosphaeraceae bacterium EP7]